MNPDPASTRATLSRGRLALRYVWRWTRGVLALIGALTLIFHVCFLSSRMTSPSMHPTLQGTSWDDGDQVLTERVTYRFRAPRRWEVVTIRRPDGSVNMKRVVAFGGETIRIDKTGHVFINEQPVDRPASLSHLRYYPIGNLEGDRVFRVERGYYLLGDDSKDSDDSRYNGAVSPDRLIGRAWLIVFPWSRIGRVQP